MYRWATNIEDSFVNAAIVYLNHEKNGIACDKREKISCVNSFIQEGGIPPLSKTSLLLL